MASEIVADRRAIKLISQGVGDAQEFWRRGSNGVEAIEAYEEPGLHYGLPHLRVIGRGGQVMARVSALTYDIIYEVHDAG